MERVTKRNTPEPVISSKGGVFLAVYERFCRKVTQAREKKDVL
jgi:hypothetical protein